MGEKEDTHRHGQVRCGDLVGDDIKAGRLVRLLPEYSDEGSDVFAIYSEKRNLAPKVRAFIDYLVEHFVAVPPWERQAPEG